VIFGLSHPKMGLSRLVVLAAAAIAAMAMPALAVAKGKGGSHGKSGSSHGKSGSHHTGKKPVGAVYTETNDPSGNHVLIFDRAANGALTLTGSVATGGNGDQMQPQPGCMPTCPILDTQGELAQTPDGHLLFAVNAGSNSISSFRVTSKGLKLVATVPSQGTFPNSLTVHGNLLYVLNSDSLKIAGFRFSHNGNMTPISGSVQALTGGLPGLPRQIGFDNSGKVLMVTLLVTMANPMMMPVGSTSDQIDTFLVKSGVAGPATAHDSTSDFPFAFAFTPRDQAVVAQVDQLTGPPGTTQSYKVTHSGSVTPISGATSGGNAPCWVVITASNRYAYVVNTGGGVPPGPSVAEYKLSPSGKLTLLGNAPTSGEFANTDEALSNDNKYLYVLVPLLSGSASTPGGKSQIDTYAVHHNGTLSFVGSSATFPAPSLSGLVAN